MGRVLAQAAEVAQVGLAQIEFHRGRHHAGADGGVEGGQGRRDEGRQHRQGVPAGEEGTDGGERAGDEDPVPDDGPAVLGALGKAEGEAGQNERQDEPGYELGPGAGRRQTLQCLDFETRVRARRGAGLPGRPRGRVRAGCGRGRPQVAGDALEVAGAQDRQDPAVALPFDLLPQTGGHVAIALVDEGQEEVLAVTGEFGEGGLQHIPFLEALDLRLGDLVVGDQGQDQAGKEFEALPPTQVGGDALEGHADLAIHQQDGQMACPRLGDGHALLGPGFDAELIRQALLVGGQGQTGDHHGHPPLADDGEEVHARQGVRVQ